MAIFAATASKLQIDSDNIWKFQRYLLVIDFANRLPLPAPLSIFHYIYYMCKNLCVCFATPCFYVVKKKVSSVHFIMHFIMS